MTPSLQNAPTQENEEHAIGRLLVDAQDLRPEQRERAEWKAQEEQRPLTDVLRSEGLVTSEILQRAIAEHYRLPSGEQMILGSEQAYPFLQKTLTPALCALLGEKQGKATAKNFLGTLCRFQRRIAERQMALEAKIAAGEQYRLLLDEERLSAQRVFSRRNRTKRALQQTLHLQGAASGRLFRVPCAEWRKKWHAFREQRRAAALARRSALEEARQKRDEERATREAERTKAAEEERAKNEAQRRAKEEERKRRTEEERQKTEGERRQREAQEKARREQKEREKAEIARQKEEERVKRETEKAARAEEARRLCEERRALRAARVASWKQSLGNMFGGRKSAPGGAAPREPVLSSPKDDARLLEEARKEAMKQIFVEQEKERLRPTHPESGHAQKEQLAAIEQARAALAAEEARIAEERRALEQARSQGRATSQPIADIDAEVENRLAGERAALAAERERMQREALEQAKALMREETKRGSGAAPAASAQTLTKQLEAERMKFELEKERIRAEAKAEMQVKLEEERAALLAKGAGKADARGDAALSQELIRWKTQVEKLERERTEIERQRALQEEQASARKEEQRVEEERLEMERARLERQRQEMEAEHAHKARMAEGKEQIEEERKHLEEEKKRLDAEAALAEKRRATERTRKEAAPKAPASKKPAGEEAKTDAKTQVAESTVDVANILLTQNYVSEEELKSAEALSKERNVSLEQVLKEEGLVTKDILQNAIAEFYKMPFLDLRSQPPDPAVIQLLPESFSVAFSAIAVERKEDGTLVIATSSPERGNLAEEVKKVLPSAPAIHLSYAAKESIEAALAFYEKPLDTRFRKIMESNRKVAPEIIEEIFGDAIRLGASDIHFEPQEKIVIVRFRVDGVMHEAGRIPREYFEGIVNRIKIAGNMRIDEHFTAQDGAIRWKGEGRSMDVRVSIVPIVDGEKIVMRLLSEYVRTLTLGDLGFTAAQREILIKAAHKPFGMLLTTGPTGSGKSTTLYGLMKIRNTPDVNISTIEDPVEYKIPGINHIQVNAKSDLTFERGLRALVRQDPDIILVGEIRDNITAQISVNAALTGHLLFSTLHANDAATAVPRLLEMGIEPYLLASTLELIIAQRLMRRICLNCRFSYNLTRTEACQLFLHADHYFPPSERRVTLYRGKGCAACGNTGYRGRVGIYELLTVTPELEAFIVQRKTTAEINDVARRQGMLTLFEDGLLKVKSGMSTIEELMRVAAPPEVIFASSTPVHAPPIPEETAT